MEILLVVLFLGTLFITFQFTKPKKKSCSDCKDDCSSCQAFKNFYEDYQKDKQNER